MRVSRRMDRKAAEETNGTAIRDALGVPTEIVQRSEPSAGPRRRVNAPR